MPIQRPFLLYLRSRFHLALALAAAGLVVLSLLFLRPIVLPVLVIVVLYVILTGAIFFTRRGAREVVAESEEDRLRMVRQKISHSAQLRERISVLRLGDEQVAAPWSCSSRSPARTWRSAASLTRYSPLANERIERVLEICQVFLGERDEDGHGQTVRRARTGGDRLPRESFAQDIVDCAAVMRQRITEDLLGMSGEERLSIMKELEENK